jgi:D-arabinose 1-dehydrogenase-like Zn-dependent alcohol dehydrogenase
MYLGGYIFSSFILLGFFSCHISLTGCQTGSIVSYDVMSSSCKTCEYCKGKNCEPKEHVCRKNWSGSAKAMESTMAVNIIKTLKTKGI